MADNKPQMSYADLLALYDKQEADRKKLEAENTLLKAAQTRSNTISFKCRAKGEKYTDGQGEEQVGKGNLIMYGLQRFPLSLYEKQWRTIVKLAKEGVIDAELEKYKGKLSQGRD